MYMGTVIAMPLAGILAQYVSWEAIFYVFGKPQNIESWLESVAFFQLFLFDHRALGLVLVPPMVDYGGGLA